MSMKGHGWMNLLFWIVWVAVLAGTIFAVKPVGIEGRVSLLIAAAALWVNLFPKFLQGPRLSCSINQITILSVPSSNQLAMIAEIAIRDLLSTSPSPQARQTLSGLSGINAAVENKDTQFLRRLFDQTHPTRYGYVPPDALIQESLTDQRATPPFFVPLTIHNAGARSGNVASIVMTMELIGDADKKWAYAGYLEVNPSVIVDPRKQAKDVDIFSGLFPGCLVRPGESAQLNLYFSPQRVVNGRSVFSANLLPGQYRFRVFGFDPNGKIAFAAKNVHYVVEKATLLYVFQSGLWSFYVNADRNIEKALAS